MTKEYSFQAPSDQGLANALSFIEIIDAYKQAGKDYANWFKIEDGTESIKSNKYLDTVMTESLKEEHFKENNGVLQELNEIRQQPSNIFIKTMSEEIQTSVREKVNTEVNNYNGLQRLRARRRVVRKFSKLDNEEQDHFWEVGGDLEESVRFSKSRAKSWKLNFATGIPAVLLSNSAAVAGGLTAVLDNLPENQRGTALILSYAAVWFSLLTTAVQYTRLMRDEKINTSPNILLTSSYFLSKQFFKANELAQNIFTAAEIPAQAVITDLLFGTLLATQEGNSIVFARNMINVGIYLLSSLGAEAWMQIEKRKKKN